VCPITTEAAEKYPGAERQPLAYPGLRPAYSYVYYRRQIHRIVPRGNTLADLRIEDDGHWTAVDAFLRARNNESMARRHAVLAVGSNGCPGRLAEKYGDQPDVAIPVFVGSLTDAAVVYSPRLVSYGALPATYLYQPGAVSWLSVTLLTDGQLAHMDKTEHVGQFYRRIAVPGSFKIDGGPRLGGVTAYHDTDILTIENRPVRLKMFARPGSDGSAPDWPAMDQKEVLSLVFDQAGLLMGHGIGERHRRMMHDENLRDRLNRFIHSKMSGLKADKQGRLIAGRP
jgi:hypothetical protein